jgi:hypothetical protein
MNWDGKAASLAFDPCSGGGMQPMMGFVCSVPWLRQAQSTARMVNRFISSQFSRYDLIIFDSSKVSLRRSAFYPVI